MTDEPEPIETEVCPDCTNGFNLAWGDDTGMCPFCVGTSRTPTFAQRMNWLDEAMRRT